MPKLTSSLLLLIVALGFVALAALPSTRAPQIVVNMPAGAKPLATLTQPGDKVVGSDRAVLWITVYRESMSHTSCQYAAEYANAAVDKVYGPTLAPSYP